MKYFNLTHYAARKKEELYLRQVVASLFPQHAISFNVRKATNIVSPSTGNLLEIDIWIPSLKIGFEYQVYNWAQYFSALLTIFVG